MTAGGADPADSGARLFAAWQRATSELLADFVRDPRTLAAGAALLNGSLRAARLGRLTWEAWSAPFSGDRKGTF